MVTVEVPLLPCEMVASVAVRVNEPAVVELALSVISSVAEEPA
jgi:hypothetical protein